MTANLTITDNANSTGVATVTNAAAGDVSSIYYSAWQGQCQAYNYTFIGNVTGNGSISISGIGTGHFLFQSLITNGGNASLGQVFHQRLSDGSTTIHRQILDAVKNRHDSIGFSWLDAADVLERFVPNALENTDGPFPKVYISPLAVEQYNNQLLVRDDVGFPVLIALVDKISSTTSNQTSGMSQMDNVLDWRIRTSRALRWQRLPGVTEVYVGNLEPQSIVDINAFMTKARIVSALSMRYFVREGRGLT